MKQIILTAVISFCFAVNASAQCRPDESAIFVGSTEKKEIAICASPKNQPYQKIEYKYGPLGNPEYIYTVDGKSSNLLYAANEACSPRAETYNIWFKKGNTTYIISECIGGNCDFEGGIMVLDQAKTVAKIKSKRNSDKPFGFTENGRTIIDNLIGKKLAKINLIQEKYLDGISACSLYE